MAESPVLVVEDVHVRYRVRKDARRPSVRDMLRGKSSVEVTVDALRGVNLELHEGDALGVVGRNGSGKSTLLKTMAGMLHPWQGRVLGRHRPVLLEVSAAFDRSLSGRRNILLGGTAMGLSRSEVAERFDEIVEFSELGEFIDLPLSAYSSGMAARLQFSVASVAAPEVLLIDEALAVGDRGFRIKSEARMAEILSQAGTLVLVSHSDATIRRVCSKVLWIEEGRVRASGSTREVMDLYADANDS